MVRIYNDGTTILSVIKMKIGDKNYYYTSVSNDLSYSSPARAGMYYGYLIRRSDNKNNRNYKPDNLETKKRIETIFKKLNVFDERLPKGFRGGKDNYNYAEHNGLRIYDPRIKGNLETGGSILPGGNRFFHVGKFYIHSHGCESIGNSIQYFNKNDNNIKDEQDVYDNIGLFGVNDTVLATGGFIENIILVYENNINKQNQSAVHIDIEVEDNIQENLNKISVIEAKEKYQSLYPPRKKQEPVKVIKPLGPIFNN
ncbi:hypothetical protein JAO71_13215 [Olleya sp. YSTF-M6]|uniref:Uncharacterized protein n=1 Tax=Olleya sediminilitoris TaxID=2795739 RepID=A0ABS1WNS2_9FLAO|nr:hypothetical protein [Olleya sediminilitoris]MBL7560762.1 hypothetical protein [Olleya sediminilitoris]